MLDRHLARVREGSQGETEGQLQMQMHAWRPTVL